MKKEDIVKELLNNSKATVAFIVLQNLAFLYAFSKGRGLYNSLRDSEEVSIIVLISFLIILVGTIKANRYMAREVIMRVDEEDKLLWL